MAQHAGDRWVAQWNEALEQHRERWDEKTHDPDRWYCISLSLAGTADEPRYSAVYIRPDTPLPRQVQVHCRSRTDVRDVATHRTATCRA